MKKCFYFILTIALAAVIAIACNKVVRFDEGDSPLLPQLKDSYARLHWIGPDYKVAVRINVTDSDGISTVRAKNGEWNIDTTYKGNNAKSLVIIDTIKVARDASVTKHNIEVTIMNKTGGVIKGNIPVEDSSATNLDTSFHADVTPPVIAYAKPTVTKFYGTTNAPVTVDVDATVTDAVEITSVLVKVYGETQDGQPVSYEESLTPGATEKQSYHYVKSFSLPAGKIGQYTYVVRAYDAAGNRTIKGGNVTVGYMDRLYLSDAESDNEITYQGFDHYGPSRGIGTLISMKQTGTNVFTVDYYYKNESTDNIRFYAYIGSDRPFKSSLATPTYTMSGPNAVAMSSAQPGVITTDLAQAGFKLPVTSKGYYHLTINMTTLTITAVPYTPSRSFADATKYPGWSDANPWTYMAVTGPVVIGSGGSYLEVANSPKLAKDPNHKYLYTGTFQTNGGSNNISINAPWAFVSDNGYGKGWFRLTAGRSSMLDDYGDWIDKVGAIGASGGGPAYGFSVSNFGNTTGTFKATYDIALERLRIVRTGN